MPHLETLSRRQKAVLWEYDSVDSHGRPLLKAAREITVRWDRTQHEGTDPLGNTITLDCALVVNEDIPVNSVMWLGALADLPGTPTELKKVALAGKVPDIKGRQYYRTVSLVRYSDTLPDLA